MRVGRLSGFLLLIAVLPACSLERRPLTRAVDAGPLDAGMPDTPVPLDVPVPMDVPTDVPVPVDARDASPIDVPVDVPVLVDVPVRVDAPDAPPPPLDAGCMPAGRTMCLAGDVLATCSGGSFVPAPSPCSLGCAAAPTPHCRQLVPTNVSEALAAVTPTGPLVISAFQQVNTTTCVIAPAGISGVRVSHDGAGPTVCLFYVASLTVSAPNGYLSVTGDVPLVIVSRGNVTVSGTIDVSSYTNQPDGTGGFFDRSGAGSGTGGAVGGNGGVGGASGDGGGGGGGFCGDGGDGATGSGGAMAGVGAAGGSFALLPLRGGAAGGRGSGGNRGDGGPGGGAFQLSVMGTLVIDGAILAAGAGGFGGGATAAAATAGGGGGSGGGLFIEAEVISIGTMGLVGAPGAGGASGSCGSTPGLDGGNGAFVTGRPAGGTSPCAGAGPGGAGAGDMTIAGSDALPVGNNGPGGGGGAGCIHFRSASGAAPSGGVVNLRTGTSAVMTSMIMSM